MEIPVINMAELAFSGFGDSMAVNTVGVCHKRLLPNNPPVAVFLQETAGTLSVCVYFGLADYEQDADDQNPYRMYTLDCVGTDASTPVLQALGTLSSLSMLIQGKTAAELDRMLRKGWNFVRRYE